MAPQVAVMRKLLDDYEAAGLERDPRSARDAAYQMLQMLTALYNAAYRADLEKARREGKAG